MRRQSIKLAALLACLGAIQTVGMLGISVATGMLGLFSPR